MKNLFIQTLVAAWLLFKQVNLRVLLYQCLPLSQSKLSKKSALVTVPFCLEIRRARQAAVCVGQRHHYAVLSSSALFACNTHPFSFSISSLTSPYASQLKKTSQLIYEMCTLLSPSKKFLKTQAYFNYSDSILLFLCIVSYKENCFKKWCSGEKGDATFRCMRSGILRGNASAIIEAVVQPQKSCVVLVSHGQ